MFHALGSSFQKKIEDLLSRKSHPHTLPLPFGPAPHGSAHGGGCAGARCAGRRVARKNNSPKKGVYQCLYKYPLGVM